MSTLIYGPNQVRLTFAGHFLANLQAATNRRFADGRGYFFTMAGTGDDGQDICASYWIHPSIPLAFDYDTEDETLEAPLRPYWPFDQNGADTISARGRESGERKLARGWIQTSTRPKQWGE